MGVDRNHPILTPPANLIEFTVLNGEMRYIDKLSMRAAFVGALLVQVAQIDYTF